MVNLKKIKNLQWMLAIYIAELLNQFKVNLANKIHKKLSEQILLFRTIKYLHKYGDELIHLRGNWFKIPELDYVFSMKVEDMYWLKFYFKEEKRMGFFNHDGHIYAKVKDFVFFLPFPYGISILSEVFYSDTYSRFNVSGGIVVDVGAFIGDTSIYFASKGAKKVTAYEPLPHLYKIAIKNVLMNKLQNIIHINNEAIGNRYGEIIIHETMFPGSSSQFFLPWTPQDQIMKSHEVKVVPLSDAILKLGQVDLLKLDCEGCEHVALRDAYRKKALKNVHHTIVEVHYNLSYILSILQKAHFKIEEVKSLGENMPFLVYASKK